jgi:hypothetical protein
MTDFDELLKKKMYQNEQQNKQASVKTKPKPIEQEMPEPESYQEEQSNINELDRRIAELNMLKKQQEEKNRVIINTGRLTEKKTDDVTPEQDQRVIDNLYNKPSLKDRVRMRRRDKNLILGKETEGTKSKQWFVFIFGIIGVFILMSLQYTIHEQWVVLITLMLGSMMFLPVGMIIGWALLDPYVRCKILRKASRKNYGVINFVGKGQKIVSKIKNFDQALIWKKNETWVITKEHVYQLSKDGDSIVEKAKIDPESIVTLIDTVPCLFVDLDSMQPLSLARDRREGINPLELGSSLKAWVDNQLAKAMFLKKTMDIYLLIILVVSIASVFIGYLNMTHMEDMSTQLKTIHGQLTDILSRLPATP